jgi:hypothetical protein
MRPATQRQSAYGRHRLAAVCRGAPSDRYNLVPGSKRLLQILKCRRLQDRRIEPCHPKRRRPGVPHPVTTSSWFQTSPGSMPSARLNIMRAKAGTNEEDEFPAETQWRRDKRRALATTASWFACSGTAGGTGHRLVWPVVLRSVATSRQTTKSDRLSHRARRRNNEFRVGFRRENPNEAWPEGAGFVRWRAAGAESAQGKIGRPARTSWQRYYRI